MLSNLTGRHLPLLEDGTQASVAQSARQLFEVRKCPHTLHTKATVLTAQPPNADTPAIRNTRAQRPRRAARLPSSRVTGPAVFRHRRGGQTAQRSFYFRLWPPLSLGAGGTTTVVHGAVSGSERFSKQL
jgi:hypothetical protein